MITKSTVTRVLCDHGGYYVCPRDARGKRMGPMVGYVGCYEEDKQWIGDVYLDMSVLEKTPVTLSVFVDHLAQKYNFHQKAINKEITHFLGAPEGGKMIAHQLAFQLPVTEYACLDKKVVELATQTSREKTELVWGRHSVPAGARVMLVEDVTNNFTTTAKMVACVEARGAYVVGIATLFNRSETVENVFAVPGTPPYTSHHIPVYALITEKLPQYRQDDPSVVEDINTFGVLLKPRSAGVNFAELMMKR